MILRYEPKTFHFKRPSGTSRGILTEKHSWFLYAHHDNDSTITGVGECSIIEGLSPDFTSISAYESKLNELCSDPTIDLTEWPSILFGLEVAKLDLQNGGKGIIFNNEFASGNRKIPINGLVWMGSFDFMKEQIDQKLRDGFRTIKMKIGAIDFDQELSLLKSIRDRYSASELTLRVDANGAFTPQEALNKLNRLASLDIHSIEQPIKNGQWEAMRDLCKVTPVPIALDEELIGVYSFDKKMELISIIEPQFIILKPSLHGGISGTKEWINIAGSLNIPWWMTSALESNIGLNAICQFAAEFNNDLPQGLGTGSLYIDNVPSNLTVEKGTIFSAI